MSGPYRDGAVHVLSERCSTCIFRPGNLMHLEPGRVKNLVDRNLADGSAITCHQTLPYSGIDALPAVCRGYADAYGPQLFWWRLAHVLGTLVEDPPPSKETP